MGRGEERCREVPIAPELLHPAQGFQLAAKVFGQRKKLLVAAQEYNQKFVEQRGDDPSVRGELARAKYRLAQITGEIGSRHEAIDLHLQAREVYQLEPAAGAGIRVETAGVR